MLNDQETLSYIRQAKNGDLKAKEILTENNVRLIKSIVKRYLYRGGVDYDDLFQLGAIGFLKAVNGFDESFGVRFSTYAVPMIAGEIKRFLRDDGFVKISRSLKTLAREVRKFIDEYTDQHLSSPSVQTIARHLNVEENEIILALDCSKSPVSLYSKGEYKDEETTELIERLPASNDEDLVERIGLKQAIESLPEREKKIILMRYFRDMTQSEVAAEIGVSQVQVSRIESRILNSFKKILTDAE